MWASLPLKSITDFEQHTGIQLKHDVNFEFKLKLFIDNVETALETQDNRTWTPVQRLYVPYCTTHANDGSCVFVGMFLRCPICAWTSS